MNIDFFSDIILIHTAGKILYLQWGCKKSSSPWYHLNGEFNKILS